MKALCTTTGTSSTRRPCRLSGADESARAEDEEGEVSAATTEAQHACAERPLRLRRTQRTVSIAEVAETRDDVAVTVEMRIDGGDEDAQPGVGRREARDALRRRD